MSLSRPHLSPFSSPAAYTYPSGVDTSLFHCRHTFAAVWAPATFTSSLLMNLPPTASYLLSFLLVSDLPTKRTEFVGATFIGNECEVYCWVAVNSAIESWRELFCRTMLFTVTVGVPVLHR